MRGVTESRAPPEPSASSDANEHVEDGDELAALGGAGSSSSSRQSRPGIRKGSIVQVNMIALEDVLNDLTERLKGVEEMQHTQAEKIQTQIVDQLNREGTRRSDSPHENDHKRAAKFARNAEGPSGGNNEDEGPTQLRLEHIQKDINSIRDFLYNTDGRGKIDSSKLDPIRMLRCDLEGLRVALKRVEAAQIVARESPQSAPAAFAAPNAATFAPSTFAAEPFAKQYRPPLAKDATFGSYSSLPVDDAVAKGGDGAGGTVQTEELNQLKTEVEEITQTVMRNEHVVKMSLIELDTHLRSFVVSNVQSSVAELSDKTQAELADLSENLQHVAKKSDTAHAIADVLWHKVTNSSMKSGLGLVARSLFAWRKRIMQHAFVHWKGCDVREAREKGENLQQTLVKLHKLMGKRRAFSRWARRTKVLHDRERLKNYICCIIKKWKSISQPDLHQYFALWKRNTSYVHYLVLENAARKERATEFAREPLALLGEVMTHLGSDTDGKLLLLATYASSSALRLERLGNSVRLADSQIKDFGNQLKTQSKEILSVLENRCESIEASAKFFRTSMTDATDKNSRTIDALKEEVAGMLGGASGVTQMLEGRMQKLEDLVADQNKKINDLLALNGDLVQRLSTSSVANEKLESALLQVRAQIATLENTSSKNVTSLQRELSVLKDNGTYLNATVSEVRTLVDDFGDEINKIAAAQQKFIDSTLKAGEKNELGRFRGGQALGVSSSARIPTPKDLADLYSIFEHKVFELRSTDQFSMLVRALTEETACELAYVAHRLASHIALAADIELMAAKIRYHQSADPIKTTSNNAPVIDEARSAIAVRDNFLFSFMDEFNALVDALPPCPLSIRTDARALFVRRFLSVFDLALRKLAPVIRNIAPNLERSPSAPPAYSDDEFVLGTATPSAKSSPRAEVLEDAPARIGHNDYYMHKTKGAPTAPGSLRPLLLSKSQQIEGIAPQSSQIPLSVNRPKTASGEGSRRVAGGSNRRAMEFIDSGLTTPASEGGDGSAVGRPRTAGASRHRTAISDAGTRDSSRFVLRGGFRIPSGAIESGSVVHTVLTATATATAVPTEDASSAPTTSEAAVQSGAAMAPAH